MSGFSLSSSKCSRIFRASCGDRRPWGYPDWGSPECFHIFGSVVLLSWYSLAPPCIFSSPSSCTSVRGWASLCVWLRFAQPRKERHVAAWKPNMPAVGVVRWYQNFLRRYLLFPILTVLVWCRQQPFRPPPPPRPPPYRHLVLVAVPPTPTRDRSVVQALVAPHCACLLLLFTCVFRCFCCLRFRGSPQRLIILPYLRSVLRLRRTPFWRTLDS